MLFLIEKKKLLISIFGVALAWNVVGSQQLAPVHGSDAAHNLHAVRKGAKVELVWKQRLQVADRSSGESRLVLARICRTISPAPPATLDQPASCGESVGRVSLRKSTAQLANTAYEKKDTEITARFTDRLPDDLRQSESPQFAVYEVEVVDDHGRTAGVSNRVPVLLTPTPAVKGLHSQLDSRGVYLIWEDEVESHPQGVEFDYRIARSEKGSRRGIVVPYLRAVVHLREGDRWTGVDTSLEWGKTYTYRVTPIARFRSPNGDVLSEVEGEESAPLEVTAHDVFPPAVPERLLTLVGRASGKEFVDLVWAPNLDKDLAGYNVFRREAGGEMVRIHTARPSSLSFQDTDVASGHTYFYSLSAVDANGNESPRSAEVEAIVP
jgi:hypothetical protein